MECATTVPVAMAKRRPHKRRIGLVVVVAAAMQLGVVAPSSATSSGHGSTRGDAPEFEESQPVAATSAPSITIVEDAVPNAAQDFSFTGCQGTSCSPFALDDDADPALPNTVNASGLTAGTYTITQAPGVNHWVLDDIFCDTGENVDVENRTVTITLGAAEDVTCTFLNRSPSIKIIEDALPDAPQDFSFTGCQGAGCGQFVLDDDGDPVLSNSVTASGLAPGTYTITQAPTANWSLDSLSCTTGEVVDLVNRQVTITLGADEFAKCTFTNRTTGIRIAQDTIPDDPQDFGYTSCLGSGCGHFTLDDDDDPAMTNSVTGAGLAPGTYTITQDITPGFDLVYIGCGGDPSNRRLTLYVEPNQPNGPCTFVNRPTPPPLTNVAQISTGSEITTCARLTSGGVRCWGSNDYGRLGTGSSDEYLSIPTTVLNPEGTGPLTDVVQVSVGNRHACAVLQNGEGRCWGANYSGQLGNGTDVSSTRPVAVLNSTGTGPLTGIAQITAGSFEQTCARLTNGEARCWGFNYQGALGDGTTTDRSLPAVVSNPDGTGPLTDVAQISTGYHSCARLSNGEARCWGPGGSGQLGNGTDVSSTRPVAVLNSTGTGPLTGIAQITAGSYRTCARVGRQARCWGGGTGSRLPVVVLDASGEAPLTNVAEITAASGRSCVRLLNGEARCWGSSSLGDGTQDYSDLPVVVSNPVGTGPLTDVAQISTGSYHSCARLSNGEARCWGGGHLGNGTPNDEIPGSNYTRPVVVISP
jgi:alpha-tubulin suppressor-like RCC1 family protein